MFKGFYDTNMYPVYIVDKKVCIKVVRDQISIVIKLQNRES